nr:hypothetical protein [Endozoicomonas sp.]
MKEVLAVLESVESGTLSEVPPYARVLHKNVDGIIDRAHAILETIEDKSLDPGHPQASSASAFLSRLEEAAHPSTESDAVSGIGEMLPLLSGQDLLIILDEYNLLRKQQLLCRGVWRTTAFP